MSLDLINNIDSFLDALPGMAYLVNDRGCVVYSNEFFKQYFSIAMGTTDIYYKDISLMKSHSEFRKKILEIDQMAFQCKKAFFSKVFFPDHIPFICSRSHYVSNQRRLLLVHCIDIKFIESVEDLYSTSSIIALKNIVRNMPGHLYWKDEFGVYQGCNDRQAQSLGFKDGDQILGKTDFDLPWLSESAKQFIENDRRIMATCQSEIFEEKAVVDSKPSIVLSHKSPLLDDKGDVRGVLGISLDISKQKETETKLKHMAFELERSNQIKSDFIQNMEHDIRTPFIGVYGIINILAEKEKNPQKKELLKAVSLSAKELMDYCDSILEFSRIESETIPIAAKNFSLVTLIESVIGIEVAAAKHKGIALSFICDEQLPSIVSGDPYRLKRILLNLLSNAIKFTENGFVKLSIFVEKQDETTREIILKFIIEDTGLGVPEDKKILIFEKFTKVIPSNRGLYKGLGLGLSIVKQFMEELGGDLHLKSELNTGSVFTILLPFRRPLSDVIIDEC